MPGWNDKNKQWEYLPDKKEDHESIIISNENLSFLLAAMVILGFIGGVIAGFFLNKFQYELKIDNAELISYETLIKKGLAKPVKDENGDLKLKLMECK